MKEYVRHFEESVKKVGVKVSPYVTQSNGSIISISETIDCPIKTAVSELVDQLVGNRNVSLRKMLPDQLLEAVFMDRVEVFRTSSPSTWAAPASTSA